MTDTNIATTTITATTHVNLRGTAHEALGFYQSVFGGDLVAISYRDAGGVTEESEADQVMWGQVESGSGFRIMAYDVPAARPYDAGLAPYYVSVRGVDTEEVTARWQALTAEGTGTSVVVPLAPAGWSPLYGMATDRFGITWVLDLAAARTG